LEVRSRPRILSPKRKSRVEILGKRRNTGTLDNAYEKGAGSSVGGKGKKKRKQPIATEEEERENESKGRREGVNLEKSVIFIVFNDEQRGGETGSNLPA